MTNNEQKEAAQYLYAEPHLTSSNLASFTRCLLSGDKKWSDINLHPHSTPGRYVTTLDLSYLHDARVQLQTTKLHLVTACRQIFPLVPSLQHLKLPTICYLLGHEDYLAFAPFARTLKSLQGYRVKDWREGVPDPDPAITALRRLPNIEVLELVGDSDPVLEGPYTDHVDATVPTTIKLDKLHTLMISGMNTSPVFKTLVESNLPSLRRLLIASYDLRHVLTARFHVKHGSKIISLTHLDSADSVSQYDEPNDPTLPFYPNLTHFAYLHTGLESLVPDLRSITSPESTHYAHSLRCLTVPRWNSSQNSRGEWDNEEDGWEPIPAREEIQPLMALLLSTPPPNLDTLKVDGFRWVRADLGPLALLTGDSGEMRSWAEKLKGKGIEMLDMDGRPAPNVAAGSTKSSGGRNGKARRRSSTNTRFEASGRRIVSDRLDEDGG